MFSHMFLLFQSLLSYSSIFAKLLLTIFFLRLSRLHGNPISCPVSPTIGTPSQYIVHVPPYFWHRMRGFLEARCSWEPCSSLTTGEFSTFCLLLKVSGANVRWTECKSYLSYSLKNPRTDTFLHDLGLAKLRSTAWVWNPQGISKLLNKVDCHLSYDSFLALRSRRQCGPSLLQNPSQQDPQRTPAI